MGIRGLLGILLHGLGAKLKLIPPKTRGFVVSRMYIDAPQMVYKAMNKIKADALQSEVVAVLDDNSVIEMTVELILEFVKTISPRDFLGIYFDGIPPMAKVVEQRARRYAMQKESSTSFNRAKITTGTAFMRILVERLLAGIADNVSWLPTEIEVSTPAEPGEGEHKLANRIRDHDAALPGTKVILADDSDVMIMSLLNNFRDCYIFVDHTPPPGGFGKANHGLLSVGAVAERVRIYLGNTPTAVYDFCLLVILGGGNDFMPFVLSGSNRRETIGLMIDIYKNTLRGQPLMTNQGREIVWAGVRSVFVELAAREEILLSEYSKFVKEKLKDVMPPIFTQSMDPKTGLIKLPFFRRAWDNLLYESKVPIAKQAEGILVQRPTQREIDADHAFSSMQYLQGLSWTLGYMRTGDGPDWYYSSATPPLFSDIARLMATGADPVRSMRSLPSWDPLPLSVYLLTILPQVFVQDLFGSTFVNVFSKSAGLGDLFPLEFSHFGPAEWQEDSKGKAILPPLGIDRITAAVAERIDVDVAEANLRALEPRVKYSRTKNAWVPTVDLIATEGDVLPAGAGPRTTGGGSGRGSRVGRCGGTGAEYEILDVVVPSLSSA